MAIPFSYNEDRIFLFPVDPESAYAYWDYSAHTWDQLEADGASVVLKLFRNGYEQQRIEVNRDTRDYFFKGLESTVKYRLELHARAGEFERMLMRTPQAETPSNHVSHDENLRFTTFRFLSPRVKSSITYDDAPRYAAGRFSDPTPAESQKIQQAGAVAGIDTDDIRTRPPAGWRRVWLERRVMEYTRPLSSGILQGKTEERPYVDYPEIPGKHLDGNLPGSGHMPGASEVHAGQNSAYIEPAAKPGEQNFSSGTLAKPASRTDKDNANKQESSDE